MNLFVVWGQWLLCNVLHDVMSSVTGHSIPWLPIPNTIQVLMSSPTALWWSTRSVGGGNAEPQVGPSRIEDGKLILVTEAERCEVFLRAIVNEHPPIWWSWFWERPKTTSLCQWGCGANSNDDVVMSYLVFQQTGNAVSHWTSRRGGDSFERGKVVIEQQRLAENQKEIVKLRRIFNALEKRKKLSAKSCPLQWNGNIEASSERFKLPTSAAHTQKRIGSHTISKFSQTKIQCQSWRLRVIQQLMQGWRNWSTGRKDSIISGMQKQVLEWGNIWH